MLRRDGFVVQPPIASALDVAHLAGIMNQIESAGWPPVFCFMNSVIWDFVVAKVRPAMRNLLGEDCVFDSGSAFAWALKATGKSTFPRYGAEFRSWQNAVSRLNRGFGSSFGYSAAESLYPQLSSPFGYPSTMQLPLTDVCMWCQESLTLTLTDAHMNPATGVHRGLSSKINFPLHGVRALPAAACSLLACWYGNTIHWGSTCSRFAKAPRKSIALTFLRNANKVSAKEAPPITITRASATMTL
jgi:hypothetical protein